MKRRLSILALPLYAVAIAIEVCVVAYRAARLEARLQREAREAVDQHRSDVHAELAKHRQRLLDEQRKAMN